jgi:uncharacterized protein
MSEDEPKENPPISTPAMPESSMEEIIASIGRIIEEDNRMPHPARTGPSLTSGVLELTEAIAADGSVRRLAGTGAASSSAEPAQEAVGAVAPRIEPPAPNLDAAAGSNPDQPPEKAKPDQPAENILSTAASEAAAAAFGRLSNVPRERRGEAELSIGAGSRTLEEIVRETLRPLLRAWLGEHLPAIVERLVREEIQRVVREAGLR